jgi:nickel-type superoxide dismutase maturation protease
VSFPLRRVLVTGPSMAPALHHGDQLLVWLRRPRAPHQGALVLVRLPDGPVAVKRLTRVEPDGRVWVEGDNALASTDSRAWGALPPEAVVGRVLLRLWPRPGYVAPSH